MRSFKTDLEFGLKKEEEMINKIKQQFPFEKDIKNLKFVEGQFDSSRNVKQEINLKNILILLQMLKKILELMKIKLKYYHNKMLLEQFKITTIKMLMEKLNILMIQKKRMEIIMVDY